MTRTPQSIWYTRCPAPTPLSLAVQLGWLEQTFASHGIAVTSIRDSSDPAVRESHYTHALDWSFRQGGNIPPIWARSGGRRTHVVGITTTDEFQAIIALPGSGLRGTADLKGRRIGVPRNAQAVIDFQRATALKGIVSALSLEDLTTQDAELVYLDTPLPSSPSSADSSFFGLRRRLPYGREVLAAARGTIDAFFVKGAEGLVLANQLGATVLTEFGFHPDPKIRINNGTPRPLTVDPLFLAERPDLVADLVATVHRVDAWAQAHPDDAVRFIARELGVGEEAVWAANGLDVHRHLRLTISDDEIAAFAHFKDFLLEWGIIPADFDVHGWTEVGPLTAASQRVLA